MKSLTSHYNNALSSIAHCHASEKSPLITLRLHAPWYNKELWPKKCCKRYYERQFLLSELTVHKISHDQCHEYNQLIENAKTKYYKDKISDSTPTNFFKVLDSILKIKTTPILPFIKSIQSLVESFAQYFEEKIPKLQNGLSFSPSSSTTSELGVTSRPL